MDSAVPKLHVGTMAVRLRRDPLTGKSDPCSNSLTRPVLSPI